MSQDAVSPDWDAEEAGKPHATLEHLTDDLNLATLGMEPNIRWSSVVNCSSKSPIRVCAAFDRSDRGSFAAGFYSIERGSDLVWSGNKLTRFMLI
ncbi:hypothetical protein J1614_009331 [Plenodomus biglobosus]|nr:hypothetical protein J1614_009331 [Plenodomus biglobosus]